VTTRFSVWLACAVLGVACDDTPKSSNDGNSGGEEDEPTTDGTDDPGDTGTSEPEPEPLEASLELLEDTAGGLPELAIEAVAISPAWLRDDVRLAFHRFSEDETNELAALIVDLDEPWLVDEVAFSIAHTSPEMVRDSRFHPQLFLDNARYIYEVDPYLAYVDLVETGEAGVDDDWSTTTTYQMADGDAVVEVELPSELYYWYVVHPRIEDESTYYIDGFRTCSSGSLECGLTPEEGDFWRPFLWELAAEQCPEGDYCPVLADFLPDADVMWSSEGGGAGAIGAIAGFMHHSDETLGRWLVFGASGERSIQPNRIYGLGRGNCGEWADMTTALARTGLIPNLNATPSSWDHTWNEFYDPLSERWVAWEPVNWWFDHGYGSRYTNYTARGDTRIEHVTDRYTDTYTLQVTVVDDDGNPIDGASVVLFSPYDDFWWYAGEAATDMDGVVSIPVVSEMEVALRVESAIGNFPVEDNSIRRVTAGEATGSVDTVRITVEASTQMFGASTLAEDAEAPIAALTVSGTTRTVRTVSGSFRFSPDTFTAEVEATPLRWFVTDMAGFDAFELGDDYAVLAEGTLADASEVPLSTVEDRVVVVVNDIGVSTVAMGNWSLALADEAGALISDLQTEFVLEPGDYHAVEVIPQ